MAFVMISIIKKIVDMTEETAVVEMLSTSIVLIAAAWVMLHIIHIHFLSILSSLFSFFKIHSKFSKSAWFHLGNYSNFHLCLSFLLRLFCPSVQKLTPVSAVVSQNVSEKYAIWVTFRPLECMRQGEDEIHTLWYFARQSQSAFFKTYFSVSSPHQCRSQAVVCIKKLSMYPQSEHFLVNFI